ECAAEVQKAMAAVNDDSQDRRIALRVGVHLGDVMVDGTDLYGDGVNVAARIEGLADPGGVAISEAVREHVHGRIAIDFIDSGHHEVKNIERPLHIWTWSPNSAVAGTLAAVAGTQPSPQSKPSIAVLPFDNLSGDPE